MVSFNLKKLSYEPIEVFQNVSSSVYLTQPHCTYILLFQIEMNEEFSYETLISAVWSYYGAKHGVTKDTHTLQLITGPHGPIAKTTDHLRGHLKDLRILFEKKSIRPRLSLKNQQFSKLRPKINVKVSRLVCLSFLSLLIVWNQQVNERNIFPIERTEKSSSSDDSIALLPLSNASDENVGLI